MAVEQAVERLPVGARVRGLALSPVAQITLWWAGSRALVIACAAFLHWIRWPRGYFHPEFRSTLAVLTSWDGRWYNEVARNGYLLVPGHQSDPAFFPLYPIALRVGRVLGLSYAASGILISNAVLLAGLIAFYRLGRAVLPERDAYRAVVFAAIAPMGFAFGKNCLASPSLMTTTPGAPNRSAAVNTRPRRRGIPRPSSTRRRFPGRVATNPRTRAAQAVARTAIRFRRARSTSFSPRVPPART